MILYGDFQQLQHGAYKPIIDIAANVLVALVMVLIVGRIASVVFRRKRRSGIGWKFFQVGMGVLCLFAGPIGWVVSLMFIMTAFGFKGTKPERKPNKVYRRAPIDEKTEEDWERMENERLEDFDRMTSLEPEYEIFGENINH